MTTARFRRARLALGALGIALGGMTGGIVSLGVPAAAQAAASDPAAQQINALNAGLIETMRAGKGQSVRERFRRLEPTVARTFDFGTMARFAVGPSWPTIPAAQQAALTDALKRLTVASYVHNFDGYSGQSFTIDPNVRTQGPDKVVSTHLNSPGSAPVPIAYRMRQAGGTWKIIDVFYNGSISQLTTRRADFAATLAKGGAPALLAHINALVDNQMK